MGSMPWWKKALTPISVSELIKSRLEACLDKPWMVENTVHETSLYAPIDFYFTHYTINKIEEFHDLVRIDLSDKAFAVSDHPESGRFVIPQISVVCDVTYDLMDGTPHIKRFQLFDPVTFEAVDVSEDLKDGPVKNMLDRLKKNAYQYSWHYDGESRQLIRGRN